MLKHYATIALRTLRKHAGYALLNATGLALGIAVCLLIALYVQHEWSYDRFHDDADRIMRVVETRATPEGTKREAGTAGPVAPVVVSELTGVEAATRLTRLFRVTVQRGDTRFYVGDYLLAEDNFFDVFSFPLAQGDSQTALAQPGTVVLTHAAAQRYFGDTDPMGRTLTVEGFGESTVTGVLEPLPETSHLQFSMLFPFATPASDVPWWTPWTEDWAHNYRTFTTYLRLSETADRDAIAAQIEALMAGNTPADAMPAAVTLQPLTDIHLRSAGIGGGFNAQPGNPAYLVIFSAIALFIILIACINYMNLATARATRRAKEVGVRKSLGAQRGQLIGQFLGEAIVLAGIALLAGVVLTAWVLPLFSTLAGKSLSLAPILHPAWIVALVGGTLLLGLTAGSYPALILSRFAPTRALKNGDVQTGRAAWLRRGLVVTQFALSIGLIVATLAVARQLDYVQEKRLGFDEDHLVMVDINSSNVRSNMEVMKTQMRQHPAVQAVSVSSRVPGDWKGITQIQITEAGAAPEDVLTSYFMGVDEDFLSTFRIDLRQGRAFDPARGTDTTAVLLNETAVAALGLDDPVGRTIQVPEIGLEGGGSGDADLRLHVIGVVDDFHFQSLYEPIRPLVLGYHQNPIENIDYFTARVEAGQVTAALDHLRSIGERFDPEHPFEYNFLDQRLAEVYDTDQRVGRLFGIAAGLAILIACFGLFGLAAFSAEQRTKEIGVRKVLGASAAQIVGLLSKDFARLVGIAFVVAVPLAYLAMDRWLADFAYRTSLGVDVFALAGLLAFAIAGLTVSYHALRAALADPVNSLRYE
jgi:putative ABC transport system permease protein